MKKEKKALAKKASEYIIHGSSIAESLKALYLEADSSMLQLSRVTRRITSVFQAAGATTKESPELGALKSYYDAVKRAAYFFDEFISKLIIDATYGSNEGRNKSASYDNWQADANDFARMSLLFFDRTHNDLPQLKKIFDFMEGLESHGLFDENDYKYFEVVEEDEETD